MWLWLWKRLVLFCRSDGRRPLFLKLWNLNHDINRYKLCRTWPIVNTSCTTLSFLETSTHWKSAVYRVLYTVQCTVYNVHCPFKGSRVFNTCNWIYTVQYLIALGLSKGLMFCTEDVMYCIVSKQLKRGVQCSLHIVLFVLYICF